MRPLFLLLFSRRSAEAVSAVLVGISHLRRDMGFGTAIKAYFRARRETATCRGRLQQRGIWLGQRLLPHRFTLLLPMADAISAYGLRWQ